MTDDELISKIRCGDEVSATELINRYYASILRYCAFHCSDRVTAEDVTQEAFLKLFNNLDRYKEKMNQIGITSDSFFHMSDDFAKIYNFSENYQDYEKMNADAIIGSFLRNFIMPKNVAENMKK